ncbi:hypothetical protein [Streptomyces lunalinharesii]|uniref:Uncharacterized protein n=1 Tax=Streptomyces lunalinharesii TaxID=333384 RepID=A0ABN3SAC5_9ACTN
MRDALNERPYMNMVSALVGAASFTGVVSTVKDNNPGMELGLAERIVEEGLKYVAACSRFPGHGLAPSRVVDEGWHGLILHTKVYADLCEHLGGDLVHHFPGWDPMNCDPSVLGRTRDRIRECGYNVDEELWGPPAGIGAPLVSVAANCQHSTECAIKPMLTPQDPRE